MSLFLDFAIHTVLFLALLYGTWKLIADIRNGEFE